MIYQFLLMDLFFDVTYIPRLLC